MLQTQQIGQQQEAID